MDYLKIERIEIYVYSIPLKKPFIISLGKLISAENILVVIKTSEGIEGIGECSPFLTIHGESQESCFITGKHLAKGLIGLNALDIESCHQRMDEIIYGNTSIKSAFDMALYDIASMNAGIPLYRFLNGKNDKIIETDYTVSLGTALQMAEDAAWIADKGFKVIKVKLGEGTEDINRIKEIRKAIGYTIPLRIDANQGWITSNAGAIINKLSEHNIQFCEEPLPRWDFMSLPALKSSVKMKLMADESCCNEHDASRLIKLNACDAFNLKTGKSSGIFRALKIISAAESAGIEMQCGGFLESRLGFTAAAHLALSSNMIRYFDFDTPLMFESDPVEGGIIYNKDWSVKIPEVPGLGASIDRKFLQKMPCHVIS